MTDKIICNGCANYRLEEYFVEKDKCVWCRINDLENALLSIDTVATLRCSHYNGTDLQKEIKELLKNV